MPESRSPLCVLPGPQVPSPQCLGCVRPGPEGRELCVCMRRATARVGPATWVAMLNRPDPLWPTRVLGHAGLPHRVAVDAGHGAAQAPAAPNRLGRPDRLPRSSVLRTSWADTSQLSGPTSCGWRAFLRFVGGVPIYVRMLSGWVYATLAR